MVEYSWSVDSWAEVDEEEYCYKCADFVIPDKGGHCPDCLEYIASVSYTHLRAHET